MVRHMVFWKLRPEGLEEHAGEMKRRLEALVGVVPGLQKAEVARCFGSEWDVCLYTELASREALAAYQDHPAHRAVKEYVHAVTCGRAAADAEA